MLANVLIMGLWRSAAQYFGIDHGLSVEQKHDLVTSGYQAAPGIGGSVATSSFGLPLSEWLVIASLLFVVLQAAFLAWKWRRMARLDREARERNEPPDADHD